MSNLSCEVQNFANDEITWATVRSAARIVVESRLGLSCCNVLAWCMELFYMVDEAASLFV